MKGLLSNFKQYPSAIIGSILVLILVGIAIYTVIAIPYDEAIDQWRGGEDVRGAVPKTARPIYVNWFTSKKLPSTMVLDTTDPVEGVEKSEQDLGKGLRDINIVFRFDFNADDFPQELQVVMTSKFEDKNPFATLTWIKPDGTEIDLGDIGIKHSEIYRFQDSNLVEELRGVAPHIALFAVPESDPPEPMKGTYELHVDAIVFEEEAEADAKFISFGQVHGIAGTDTRRRELSLALLWGTPIALSFGLLAAVGTSFTTMFIAATGVWFGGVVDESIQRVTEINMMLPFLPFLIMVGTFYSRSIWTMLAVVILLSIFGGSIKTYRAIFLQVKESQYIEAARSYGAGNWRIITRYLVPRIIPVLIPGLVSAIPSYVFLEASLAILGLGDPILPTWGKVINDARMSGALYNQNYYWILQPAVLLMITGLGFALIGFALDRIFNPKLREV
jgi:peptide/nickel transport system permease protein